MRRFVARFNISCTLIGNRPQSLTGYIVRRYRQFKKDEHYGKKNYRRRI